MLLVVWIYFKRETTTHLRNAYGDYVIEHSLTIPRGLTMRQC